MVEKSDVAAVLELIRPSLQADGGDVALVDVSDDGVVTVELQGACKGCPMSQIRLCRHSSNVCTEAPPCCGAFSSHERVVLWHFVGKHAAATKR